MFGGFRLKSAAQASFELGLTLEEAKASGTPMSSMSIGIQKCFDQVSRELVVAVALRMNCPRAIVMAWYRAMGAQRL